MTLFLGGLDHTNRSNLWFLILQISKVVWEQQQNGQTKVWSGWDSKMTTLPGSTTELRYLPYNEFPQTPMLSASEEGPLVRSSSRREPKINK